MKTILTKNVCVSDNDISINNYPEVFAISLDGGIKQFQISEKKLDSLILLLTEYKKLRNTEHLIKDVIIT